MILNRASLQIELGRSVDDECNVIKIRDDIELSNQNLVKNKYLNSTFIKDELFKNFSSFIQNFERCKNRNERSSIVENWAIWLTTKDYDEKKKKEKEIEEVQKLCNEEGYAAYNTHSDRDSLFSSIQHQLSRNPVHKNLTVQNYKELAYNGIQNNQELYQIKIDRDDTRLNFIKEQADERRVNYEDVMLDVLSKELDINIAVVDKLKEPTIKKVSNHPTDTVTIARDSSGSYYSMMKERIGETNLDRKIHEAVHSLKDLQDYHRHESLEDARLRVRPLLKEIQRHEYERAQEDRKVQLERDIKRFKEFQNRSENGQYSRNPVHSILEGNQLSNAHNFKQAISKYEQAKTLDSVFSMSAGYN